MEFLRAWIILPMMLFLTASSVRAVETPRPDINPALLYWQAFAAMEELSSAEATLLGGITPSPDDGRAHALLTKYKKALNRFRKASESNADCDWGLSYEEGPHLPLPHVSKIQTLSRLALLKADTLFAEHQTGEAMDWLLSVHRAARHCGSGDLIIPVMSQFQLEQSAIKTTAAHVLDWDAPTRREYLSKWKALPSLHTVKDAIKGELHFIDWLENFWLQDAGPPIPAGTSDTEIMPGPEESSMTAEERAQAEKMLAQFTVENIRKWIHEMRDLYLKMQTALDKPWLEGTPELLALQSEYKNSENLILRLASPMPLHKVNDLSYKTATLSTMLQAALEQGPLLREDNLGAYQDAYTGTPFTLDHSKPGTLVLRVSPETQKKIGAKIELPFPLPEPQ